MKTVCAWCQSLISGDPNSKEVSHGICSKCRDRARLEAKLQNRYGQLDLKEILELIDQKFTKQQKKLYEQNRATLKVREAFFKVLLDLGIDQL